MIKHQKGRIAIVVLGDIGRSPRMQYHALALAASPAEVDLIGYAGSAPHCAILEHPAITCYLLSPPTLRQPHRLPRPLFLAYTFLKVLVQCFQLLWLLLYRVRKPDYLLVQTPPAIPTLIIALVVARLRSATLVIDWHNFGYSMLALTIGRAHPTVRLARWYERMVGRKANAHLCVSRAMQEELCTQWGLHEVTVLYDRPAEMFVPTPLPIRRELFRRLQQQQPLPPMRYDPDAANRPALIVSATSWTADEDFSMLIKAAEQCEEMILRDLETKQSVHFPHLVFLLTGKGSLRAYYEEQFARLRLRHMHFRTLWLTAEDYPLLLGAADLGLCLHQSSSGLDLPMKVADMFGAGLPVCAFDYGPCLAEQVRHGDNGLVFSTSEQLAQQLHDLFAGFPNDTPLLTHLRGNARESGRLHWNAGWEREARPVFSQLSS